MLTLQKPAQAGTLESSDMLVAIIPAPKGAGIQINLISPTKQQYGNHIRNLIEKILQEHGVTDAEIEANDKGAVDFVIEARMKTAILRAAEAQ